MYKLLPWMFNQNLILYMYVFRHDGATYIVYGPGT